MCHTLQHNARKIEMLQHNQYCQQQAPNNFMNTTRLQISFTPCQKVGCTSTPALLVWPSWIACVFVLSFGAQPTKMFSVAKTAYHALVRSYTKQNDFRWHLQWTYSLQMCLSKSGGTCLGRIFSSKLTGDQWLPLTISVTSSNCDWDD